MLLDISRGLFGSSVREKSFQLRKMSFGLNLSIDGKADGSVAIGGRLMDRQIHT